MEPIGSIFTNGQLDKLSAGSLSALLIRAERDRILVLKKYQGKNGPTFSSMGEYEDYQVVSKRWNNYVNSIKNMLSAKS